MSSSIVCSGLSCGYPGRTVLEAVDLEFPAGSLTALLGPNGSGKSTLLKTLAKTTPPLAGSATIDGADIASLSHRELARLVAFVPQEEHVEFGFTTRQIVTMGRMPLSGGLFDTPEDNIAAIEAMESADCLNLADRPVTELSGGEKQRVLIARALAQGAKVLLMDEPTSHLDVGHQVSIGRLLKGLSGAGYTIVLAVHDLNLASSWAQDAVLLDRGRIGMHAPISEVLGAPLIDRVYGVQFRRIAPPDGGTFMFPSA